MEMIWFLIFAGGSTDNTSAMTQVEHSGPLPDSTDFSPDNESQHLLAQTETLKLHSPVQNNFKPILLPPKSPMRLFLPTMTQLDPGVLQLWPPPQTILQHKGTSYVPPLQLAFVLMATRNMKPRKCRILYVCVKLVNLPLY